MSLDRANVFQKGFVGKETTEGTAIATLTQFNKLGLKLDPHIEMHEVRQLGNRFSKGRYAGKKWSGVSGGGEACYDELNWVFDWLIDIATASTPGGGTNTRDRTWQQAATFENTPAPFTVKQGDKRTRAHRAAGSFLTGFDLTWDDSKVEVAINGLGRKFEDNVQLDTNEVQRLTSTATSGTIGLAGVNPLTGAAFTVTLIAFDSTASAAQTKFNGRIRKIYTS